MEAFCVSAIFSHRKVLGIREGGSQDFPSKTFCLTVPKILVGELFGVSENLEYRKTLCIGGGGVRFSVENNLSHSTEKLRRGHVSVCQNFGFQKIFCMRGISRFSVGGGGGGGGLTVPKL